VQQAPDDGRLPALEDLEHAALGPTLAVVADDARLDAVAVQHRAHLLRREIEVGLAIVADQKAVAVTVPLHRAFDLAHELGADTGGGIGE
jgi:hypothetical protein